MDELKEPRHSLALDEGVYQELSDLARDKSKELKRRVTIKSLGNQFIRDGIDATKQ